ncbi:MAG: LysR substrate-binding domain-containing protein [Oleiphilaceae bacterium]|nr:LysR substrate-binding domain-containing protein [Oleiphilaceae bacterium]
MQHQPPPIQWLPVFEAAARHLNFKTAANELNVTPPAVSQQIKALETYLGVTLFDRRQRKLALTPAGRSYYEVAQEIVGLHMQGFKQLMRQQGSGSFQISAPIFIAQELLIPHYGSFSSFAPHLDLRIVTGNELVDFSEASVDAAIRFGIGPWPGLERRLIQKVELALVCSPRYLEHQPFSESGELCPQQLASHRLISLYDDLQDWRMQCSTVTTERPLICDSYFSVMRAAEEGLGLAIGLRPLIDRLIRTNKLVSLPCTLKPTDHAYWLVYPETASHAPHIDAAYQWISSLFDSHEQSKAAHQT